jgi:hypothetical protein
MLPQANIILERVIIAWNLLEKGRKKYPPSLYHPQKEAK